MISLASASNTASNIVVYFVSRSLIRNRSSSMRSPRSIARFRGLLGDPAAGRVGRHAGDMQLPGRMSAKISTYKRLSSTCRCEEVTGDCPVAPVPTTGSHSGRYAAARGRSLPASRFATRVRDRVTEPGKRALDPAVTSARVCPGHRNDELLDRRSGRWAAAAGAGDRSICGLPADDATRAPSPESPRTPASSGAGGSAEIARPATPGPAARTVRVGYGGAAPHSRGAEPATRCLWTDHDGAVRPAGRARNGRSRKRG